MHKYSSHAELICWKGNGIDAKGQCRKNWPSSCNCIMCLMCSDIIFVEINCLGQSELVIREIPMTRHKLSSNTSIMFLAVCFFLFYILCFTCERGSGWEYSVLSCSWIWLIDDTFEKERELLMKHLQCLVLFAGRKGLFSVNNRMVMIKLLLRCCHSMSWSLKRIGLNFTHVDY